MTGEEARTFCQSVVFITGHDDNDGEAMVVSILVVELFAEYEDQGHSENLNRANSPYWTIRILATLRFHYADIH